MNKAEVVAAEQHPLIAQRRYLHMHPELSFHETETYQYIRRHLTSLPNLELREQVGGHGIVAKITGGTGPTIAFRADFDALPIQDEKEVPYQSTVKNVMHACGHDGHTSTLLSLATILSAHQSELSGSVVLLFQFAEELAPGGARPMVDDGALDGVDAVYGNHFWSQFETNTIHSAAGPLMASPDMFNITIYGRGGHGAKPHTTIDAVVVMAEFIMNIQTIVARNVNPIDNAVLTIGKVTAGNTFNVISDRASCSGTVRTFNADVQQTIRTALENELKGLAVSKGITYELNYVTGYPPVVNHEAGYEVIKRAAARAGLDFDDAPPMMIGEDFSYYLLEKPGAFFLTGSGNEEKTTAPHHHPLFDLDEDAMSGALTMFLAILEEEGVIHAQ
ncbi:amidohydrolase [Macrococcus equipercicus]|uniref:Amidohydrolase n=1 Tax=Macrococcus equipercicus TaxID=69967 RepID=A0A9Q9F392_9STAP|nr:amidohydrolase [Macrococcus equipercicus]UTH13679.1 amidohydrolase [Macrococcus equipercicus]